MWLQRKYIWAILLPLFLLSSCGFEPVYGTRAGAPVASGAVLGQIEIDPIPEREGQILKIALEDILNPQSQSTTLAPYRLSATLSKTSVPAAIGKDGNILRYNLIIDVSFTLTYKATAKLVYQGSSRRIGSFNRLNADFSTFIADRDVTKRTLEELAQDIAMRLSALNITTGKSL